MPLTERLDRHWGSPPPAIGGMPVTHCDNRIGEIRPTVTRQVKLIRNGSTGARHLACLAECAWRAIGAETLKAVHGGLNRQLGVQFSVSEYEGSPPVGRPSHRQGV